MIRHICKATAILLLVSASIPAYALDVDIDGDFGVVILKGGGTIKQINKDLYLDTRKTRSLSELVADGWEVITVLPGPGIDHTVYLRRR